LCGTNRPEARDIGRGAGVVQCVPPEVPMSRLKVRVQHMVACHTVRQYGTNPTAELLAVAYRIQYPLDTEFPVTVPQIDLFTRFFVFRPGAATVFIRIREVRTDASDEELVATSGPYRVDFPTADSNLDRSFRVKYLHVPRPGTYAFRLCRRVTKSWKGSGWKVLATEYVSIGRG
jgi:hypothetical protein